ncbi:MAG: HAMP domain-containing protein, partial [Bacteroidia bacterium]
MRIGVKIALAFFLVAFLSMMVIGIISYLRARHSLEQQCFDKLTAVREMKSEQIQDYFQIIKDQITTEAEDAMIINAMKDLKKGYNTVCSDLKLQPDDIGFLREKVENYFEDEYITRLNSNLSVKASLATEISYKKESIVLQHLYYEANPDKVGKKLNMTHAGDSSFYSRSHARYHPVLRDFLEKFGYYDIFLIDNETGNIVYTVYKETDFATSLTDGPFKNTNLAKAFKAAAASDSHDFVKLVDFEAYHPSYNQSASFIACPIFEGDKKIGVLAYQMPIEKIDDIMTSKKQWSEVGLGKTGETYIVGGDYTLRNQSRFLIEDSVNYFKMLADIGVDPKTIHRIRSFGNSVGLQDVHTEGTEAALKGRSDTRIFKDYRGVPVLSAFKPLHIMGMHWVLMSEIDEAEAFEQITRLRNNIIVGFLCLLVVVFIVSYYMSREITRPLKELTVDAEELSRGNLEVNIVTGRKDEIGILATSFKTMQGAISKLVNDLRQMNHNLEEKVIERTAEV